MRAMGPFLLGDFTFGSLSNLVLNHKRVKTTAKTNQEERGGSRLCWQPPSGSMPFLGPEPRAGGRTLGASIFALCKSHAEPAAGSHAAIQSMEVGSQNGCLCPFSFKTTNGPTRGYPKKDTPKWGRATSFRSQLSKCGMASE